MKMHSKWITALFAVTFLCTPASGRQQEPQVLAPGPSLKVSHIETGVVRFPLHECHGTLHDR